MLNSELIPAKEANSKWLMVVLHGLGDSMEGYRWLPSVMGNPRLNYLLVDAPDNYYGGFSWYDIYDNPSPGIERSRKLLFTLMDQQRKAGYHTEKTFLFGFSQGCLMTLETGLRYPYQFAGLVGISGYANEPKNLINELSPVAKDQKFLITHGTTDPLLPLKKTKSHIDQLRTAGVNIQWEVFEKEHTIQGEEEMSVIRDFVKKNMEIRIEE
ncbi:MAG: serine esterase [Verrucomicrobiota bacterium]|nr:serine esterase [Verrucomicrobiota bacterium]